MPEDKADLRRGAMPVLRLTVVNATDADQNFGVVVRLEAVDVVPDTGAAQVLAWKVAVVPGRSASVTSRCHFEWVERGALMLGRFGRGAQPRFLSEALLPVAAGAGTFRVGFVGSPGNGAAKLLQVEAGDETSAVLATDGSFPSPLSRSGTTRNIAVAVAFDPEDDLAGAAFAVPLASNMMMGVAWRPSYRVMPLPPEASRGSVLPPELSGSAYDLDFAGREAVTVRFTDRNAFETIDG